MRPGFHEKTTFADYAALDAVNFHRLSDFRRSPAHCFLRMREPVEPSRAMIVGAAVHALVLEPEIFQATYATVAHDGRTREGKAEREHIAARSMIPLSLEEAELVYGMAGSLVSHPRVARLLEEATAREQTAVWQAPQGRLCKARRDLVGPGWIADLKTVASLDRFTPWTVTDLGYYRQAAWYSLPDGILNGKPAEHFFFAVVVSSPPHESQVFRLTAEAWNAGRAENERLLELYLACEGSGTWPGHVVDLGEADVSWARSSEIAGERGGM